MSVSTDLLSTAPTTDTPYPNRANPTGSVIDYQHNITLANAASAVPAGAGVQAGFLIDPSKFTSVPHGTLQRMAHRARCAQVCPYRHPAG